MRNNNISCPRRLPLLLLLLATVAVAALVGLAVADPAPSPSPDPEAYVIRRAPSDAAVAETTVADTVVPSILAEITGPTTITGSTTVPPQPTTGGPLFADNNGGINSNVYDLGDPHSAIFADPVAPAVLAAPELVDIESHPVPSQETKHEDAIVDPTVPRHPLAARGTQQQQAPPAAEVPVIEDIQDNDPDVEDQAASVAVIDLASTASTDTGADGPSVINAPPAIIIEVNRPGGGGSGSSGTGTSGGGGGSSRPGGGGGAPIVSIRGPGVSVVTTVASGTATASTTSSTTTTTKTTTSATSTTMVQSTSTSSTRPTTSTSTVTTKS
ncbi:hypothetical protein BC828DRAFT_403415 [Blastocladiella britannica]|nr:hypothetical protein BC828DRAFT_403415 [Blastocladiella britannica]